ncbi:MAG: T9SS type A sorting domain-containing protein, partial [Candidatus Cloacimonetes bacterium]|nr:T9SS type A sorting domain-containing protein [Candidatus Cloacimonadota bacterium]
NYEFIDEYPVETNNTYWYWLESVSNSNDTEIYGPTSLTIPEGETPPQLPTRTELYANYPNPFNPETTIDLTIKEGEIGTLSIYNAKGQLIESHKFEAGEYNFEWEASSYSSGVYFYKLESESYSETKKMLMIK